MWSVPILITLHADRQAKVMSLLGCLFMSTIFSVLRTRLRKTRTCRRILADHTKLFCLTDSHVGKLFSLYRI